MEMKQNEIFFHGTYSNLNSHRFLSKRRQQQKIKVFEWLLKPRFLSFATTVNQSNRNETKSDIFSLDIFKSDNTFYWSQNTKYFNDFYNFKIDFYE